MDVAITDLRSNLSGWLLRVREGEEIVVTDRGLPIARLIGLDSTATIERLTELGQIARPTVNQRPKATGRKRPRTTRPLAELITEQRR